MGAVVTTDSPAAGVSASRGRRQLVAIWLLFLAPMVAAWLVWQYISTTGVSATSNAGELIVPARPLTAFESHDADGAAFGLPQLRGRWTYVVLSPTGDCDQRCLDQLHLARQTHKSINKDMPRVQRLLVFASTPSAELVDRLSTQHPGLHIVSGARGLVEQFGVAPWLGDGSAFFLLDPHANWMMAYTLDVDPKGLRRDLRRLLKISQIG